MPVAEPPRQESQLEVEVTHALLATQYGTWYPKLRKKAPKSVVLDLSTLQPEFLQWLEEDGVVLSQANDQRNASPGRVRGRVEQEAREALSEESDEEVEVPQFPALNARIFEILDEYGPIFPKLNWSAPLDAAWILPGNTIKCQSPNDVYLVLKSSDFAMKDVEQMKELQAATGTHSSNAPRLELVLKKWFEMPRSHEFRTFVRDGRLVAVCQRDVTFYEHLQDEETQQKILSKLRICVDEVLPALQLADAVLDIYLTRHLDHSFVIDVNPYLPRTDPLLWSFEELDQCAQAIREDPSSPIPLRLLTSPAQASQSQPTYSANMVPADVVEIGSGQNIAEFAKEWNDQLAAAMDD